MFPYFSGVAESYLSALFLCFALGPKSGSPPGCRGYKGREKLTESQEKGQIQSFQVFSGNHQGVFRQRVFPYPLCRESRSERSTMAKREIPGGKDLPSRCTSERPNDQNNHAQIHTLTKTYPNSHPPVEDTQAEELLAVGGVNSDRFGSR